MLLNMFDKKMAEMLNMDIHSFRTLRGLAFIVLVVVLGYVNIIFLAVVIGFMLFNSSMSWYDLRDKFLDDDLDKSE